MPAFDPYHKWLGIPPDEQPANHYRLLGIAPLEADADVIAHAADQRMTHLRTLINSPHRKHVDKLLNEVAKARVALLDTARKHKYDSELKLTLDRAADMDDADIDGTAFGEYVLLDQLGRGGTGQVFKARHRTMHRIVALKMLSAEASRSDELVRRFHRKIRILSNLQHPNLVMAFDAGYREDRHFLSMEFVDGVTLQDLRAQQKTVAVPMVINCAVQAARGLEYAHVSGVFHRNVKPHNILLDRQGRVKVIGMGLARLAQPHLVGDNTSLNLTEIGRAMGTVDYMAPEQAIDSSSIDHRADIYSLGCTIFAMLIGRSPYGGSSTREKIIAHREQPIPSLHQLRPEIPVSLDAVLQRMLAKTPEKRLSSMGEVISALQSVS